MAGDEITLDDPGSGLSLSYDGLTVLSVAPITVATAGVSISGLTSVGTSNQLVGTNNAASGWEYKSATLTAAGALGVTTVTASGLISGGTGKFGGASHYSSFEADGTLVFTGDATVWDDIRVPVTTAKRTGVTDPSFQVFKTNGAGSVGVFVEWFSKSVDQELYFEVQLPHGYKTGTALQPHIHWTPKTNGASGAKVSWGLEYTWANIGGDFGNTSIIYANTHYPADAVLVAGRHYLTSFADLTGARTLSAMLVCRVFRDAVGAGLTDDYDDVAGLLEIDFHYEADTIGSRQPTTK